MNRIVGVAILALALAGCGRASAESRPGAPSTIQASVARFHVEGMACSSCANRLREGLRKLDGVKDVQADLSKKEVVVSHDETRISAASIKSEIVSLGFEVG